MSGEEPRPKTPETRGKSRKAVRRPAMVGGLPYPVPSSEAATRVFRGNRRTDTVPEVRLRSELHRRGFRFRKDLPIVLPGLKVRPDIVFTRYKVAVFVDGCFWHRCPDHGTSPRANSAYWGPKLDRNVSRDAAVNSALDAAGWQVVRVWEHDAPTEAANVVAAVIRSRSQSARRLLT